MLTTEKSYGDSLDVFALAYLESYQQDANSPKPPEALARLYLYRNDAVGFDLLIDEGLARGTERLTFKRVFDRASEERGVRVTNASVIGRIWVDMADYQADVLAAALEAIDQAGVEFSIRAAGEVLAGADLASVDGRRAAATEMVRVVCAAHVETMARSRTAHLTIGLRGLGVSRLPTEEGTPAAESLLRAYEVYCVRWDFALGRAFEMLGVRMRPGLTIRQLSMVAISLAEGFIVWDRLDPVMSRHILRPTGPEGEKQEWTLFSMGLEALLWQFAELDEHAGTPAGPGASAGNPE